MIGLKLLTDDWQAYDNRKLLANEDRSVFCCEEPWELNYLADLIEKQHPEYSTVSIRLAIRQGCRALKPPRLRKEFVQYVMRRLILG